MLAWIDHRTGLEGAKEVRCSAERFQLFTESLIDQHETVVYNKGAVPLSIAAWACRFPPAADKALTDISVSSI